MSLWTKCPVKVDNNYGGLARVGIPDRQSKRDWRYQTLTFNSKYGELLRELKTEFVILFTTLEACGEAWLAKTFKNGLVMQYPFVEARYAYEKTSKPQLHVYPLIMLPWFQQKYRKDRSEKDPVMFVDSKIVEWTKDVCFSCPQMLERSLKQCSAIHESCTKPLVDEKNLPTREWLNAHATETDNVVGFTYRPIKDMAVTEAFDPFSIHSLTDDEAEVEKLREKRSEAATTAAQSRFVVEVACKQCILKPWCGGFRRGGSWCKGLHQAEDYDYLHEKCEPWMAHVMLLTQQEPIDANLIQSWKGTRTNAYVLRPALGTTSFDPEWYDKYKDDYRSVVLMRNCNGHPWIRVPYLHACKLLNVKPVNSWDELPPSFKASRSLRAVAYGLASGRIYHITSIKSGWGSRTVDVVKVAFVAGKYTEVSYNNNRCNSESRYKISDAESFYTDLIDLPGMHEREGASFSEARTLENAVFHEAVIERRFTVTLAEVREACRTFNVRHRPVDSHAPELYKWLEERSKERCRQKRRSSKQPAS